jgi:cell division protein ZapB
MISQFHHLSGRIDQLAELTLSLRRENADLRLYIAALTTENTGYAKRMHEAHQRISMLIEKLPAPLQEELLGDGEGPASAETDSGRDVEAL